MATTDAVPYVDVIYALRDVQYMRRVALLRNCTVSDVLEQSGLLAEFPELVADVRVGIHGERVTLEDAVHDGDRIELYRPLQADPKDSRRRRAASRQRV